MIKTRLYNICIANNIDSLEALDRHFSANNDFYNLSGCGKKCNLDLTKLISGYRSTGFDFELKEGIELKRLENSLNQLDEFKIKIIEKYLQVTMKQIPVITKNILKALLKGNHSLNNFSEKLLLNKSLNIEEIRGVGLRKSLQLKAVLESVKSFIFKISAEKDRNRLAAYYHRYIILNEFSIASIPKTSGLNLNSIFSITDFLFNENLIFKKRTTQIVKFSLKLYSDLVFPNKYQIAEEHQLAIERIRQIKLDCIPKMLDKLKFLNELESDLFNDYGIDTHLPYIPVTSELVNLINTKNGTKLTDKFITLILYAHLKDKFSLIGNYNDALVIKVFKKRFRHNWKNIYLVKKEISSAFDFDYLLNDYNIRFKKKDVRVHAKNFPAYLADFLIYGNKDILPLVIPVAKELIVREFGGFVREH